MSTGPPHVPFNRVYFAGGELEAIREAVDRGHISSDGQFTERCERWLEQRTSSPHALLMPSCTAALEAAAMLIDCGPGDEVIMPSYTFSSTANAFVLRGAVPVFVDVREDTLNLDETLVGDAIGERTRAIVPVHYGGVGCEMGALSEIARRHELRLVEDAAQGILAARDGTALGALGDLAAISFHETKDVTCGEGGALLVNDESLLARAEIVRDKGTNRRSFFRGDVDKYTWVDVGSSYGMSDLNAAFLWAQLQAADEIRAKRLAIWDTYHRELEGLECDGLLRRPVVPDGASPNAHLYYVLVAEPARRDAVLGALRADGVDAVFHYVPLHSSEAGRRFGRSHGALEVTDRVASSIIRLPLWAGMSGEQIELVIGSLRTALTTAATRSPA